MAKFRNPFSIADFSTRLAATVIRFPLTVVACFTLMFFVVSDVNEIDMFHCAEAIVISLAVSIGCEGRVKPWLNWVITAAALAVWTLYSIFFRGQTPTRGRFFGTSPSAWVLESPSLQSSSFAANPMTGSFGITPVPSLSTASFPSLSPSL